MLLMEIYIASREREKKRLSQYLELITKKEGADSGDTGKSHKKNV